MAKSKIQKVVSEPPISGGNSYAIDKIIDALNQNIKLFSNVDLDSVKKSIITSNSSQQFCYNIWYLLMWQVNYFANLVPFKFNNLQVNRQIAIAIKVGLLYGCSALWKVGNKCTAMYVNEMKYNEFGEPQYLKMYRADYVLQSQSTEPPTGIEWVERDVTLPENKDNFLIFIPNNENLGMIVTWMPFIKQFEKILKILYTHLYTHNKSIMYTIKDKNTVKDEVELFFSAENPFVVNVGDGPVLGNRFEEFDVKGSGKDKEPLLFMYIDKFLELYYTHLGRRFNVDDKRERNITSEVNASQDNFDVLQWPIKCNIIYLLEQVEEKFGWKNLLNSQKELEDNDEDDDIKLGKMIEDNLGGGDDDDL